VLVTAAVFLPTLGNGFVNWDDDLNLLYNAAYRGLGDSQVRWAFTTFLMGHYIPVTWLTFGIDYLLWGMRPAGYHLTSLLLHLGSVVTVYFVAIRLLRAARPAAGAEPGLLLGSGVAALLFAMHPLRVESVAWVTERRDVLCGFFYLLAVLVYLRACERSAARPAYGQGAYWGSLGLFALALLSKSMAVSLPIVLLVVDVYPLRRLGGAPARWLGTDGIRIWLEKLPFALLSLVASIVALVALESVRGVRPIVTVGLAARVAISVYSLAFYLWKTVLPIDLSPLYELPARIDPMTWPYLVSALVVAAITLAAVLLRRRLPALLAVWVSYVVIVLPVVGIVQNGPQIAADRYTYLASVGWAILVGGGIRWWWAARAGRPLREPLTLAAGGLLVAVIAVLGVLTWRQVGFWRDSGTLWSHALAVGPSSLGYNNLGAYRAAQGDFTAAERCYHQALAIKPDYVDARSNLGVALAKQGRLDEAIKTFTDVLAIKPEMAEVHYNLGRALAQAGRQQEALEHYRRAAALRPGLGAGQLK
jgi:tetratricopeptide (TPR) repeat protein